jgi:hypothetical protein
VRRRRAMHRMGRVGPSGASVVPRSTIVAIAMRQKWQRVSRVGAVPDRTSTGSRRRASRSLFLFVQRDSESRAAWAVLGTCFEMGAKRPRPRRRSAWGVEPSSGGGHGRKQVVYAVVDMADPSSSTDSGRLARTSIGVLLSLLAGGLLLWASLVFAFYGYCEDACDKPARAFCRRLRRRCPSRSWASA